jgi:multidrug resistance efflux pump
MRRKQKDPPEPTSTLSGLGNHPPEPGATVSQGGVLPDSAVVSHTVARPQESLAPPTLNEGETLPLGSRLPEDWRVQLEPNDVYPVPTPRVPQFRLSDPSADPMSLVSGSRALGSRGQGSRNQGASAVSAPPPTPRVVPFRENALRQQVQEPVVAALPEIGNDRWALLGFLGSAVFLALAVAYFGKVEVTSVAAGAVVVEGGPRPVHSQVAGPITELLVAAGDTVQAGQVVARIDAADLQARRLRSEEQVTLLRAENERITASSAQLLAGAEHALRQKRALLAQRANLKQQSGVARNAQVGQLGKLADEGAVSQLEALTAREHAATVQDETLMIRQQIADIDLELGDRQKAFDDARQLRAREISEAVAGAREASALIDLTSVRAPVAGRVESLQVTRGQVVQAGMSFARIIPAGAATSIVVFAPVKDAGFLESGLTAEVEFASLPVSEFGKVGARVSRVSVDVASSDETAQVLGSPAAESLIRVELQLDKGAALQKVEPRLRSGERVIARLNTRKRRIITLVFDFMRRWYPS